MSGHCIAQTNPRLNREHEWRRERSLDLYVGLDIIDANAVAKLFGSFDAVRQLSEWVGNVRRSTTYCASAYVFLILSGRHFSPLMLVALHLGSVSNKGCTPLHFSTYNGPALLRYPYLILHPPSILFPTIKFYTKASHHSRDGIRGLDPGSTFVGQRPAQPRS